MSTIQAIPALGDNANYIWLIHATHDSSMSTKVLIVDPGEAAPVIAAIASLNLTPHAILITHRHWDHVNGIADLVAHYNVPVYAPKNSVIPHRTHSIKGGDMLEFLGFPPIKVLDLIGHTEDHIGFLMADKLFCGDTLFGAGCGRLLGGTTEQLYDSLLQLHKLPAETEVYCAHEYTLQNLQFATMLEPDNAAIQQRIADATQLRENNQPTLPSTMSLEVSTNPFLRCHQPVIRMAAERYAGKALASPLAVFTVLRTWKNIF